MFRSLVQWLWLSGIKVVEYDGVEPQQQEVLNLWNLRLRESPDRPPPPPHTVPYGLHACTIAIFLSFLCVLGWTCFMLLSLGFKANGLGWILKLCTAVLGLELHKRLPKRPKSDLTLSYFIYFEFFFFYITDKSVQSSLRIWLYINNIEIPWSDPKMLIGDF